MTTNANWRSSRSAMRGCNVGTCNWNWHDASSTTTKPTPLLRVAKRQAKELKRLETENDALKKKNRKLPLALRIAKSQTSVATRRTNEVENCNKQLADERLRAAALQGRNELLEAELRLCERHPGFNIRSSRACS